MHKYCLFLSVFILLSLFVTKANAQNFKTGVVDIAYINQALNRSSVEKANLDKVQQQYYEDMEKDKKAIDAKIAARGKLKDDNLAGTIESDVLKLDAKRKANQEDVVKRIAAYSKTMQRSIQLTIQEVATEKGYTIILDVQNTPYFTPESNITNLVLTKLGIK